MLIGNRLILSPMHHQQRAGWSRKRLKPRRLNLFIQFINTRHPKGITEILLQTRPGMAKKAIIKGASQVDHRTQTWIGRGNPTGQITPKAHPKDSDVVTVNTRVTRKDCQRLTDNTLILVTHGLSTPGNPLTWTIKGKGRQATAVEHL